MMEYLPIIIIATVVIAAALMATFSIMWAAGHADRLTEIDMLKYKLDESEKKDDG